MQRADIPLRYAKVWAVNAAGAYIRTVPVDSQIGIEDGAASFDTGFVPDNFSPVSAGGVPPFGQDFNGLLNADTAWMQWKQAGGAVPYDAAFSTAIGGYPQGAVVDSGIVYGAQWYSTVDNNTTDPDDPLTSSGWLRVGIPAGMPLPFISTVPTGFVLASGAVTIGSATSAATYAAANALFLFAANWSNSQLLIYTSGGVLTTRGANAVADFAANKRLAMPDIRGAGLIGVDSSGSTNLSGVPVVAGNTTTPGSTLGANLHTLTSSEIAAHYHAIGWSDPGHFHQAAGAGVNAIVQAFSGGQAFQPVGGGSAFTSMENFGTGNKATGITFTGAGGANTTGSTGGGGSHNTAHRSLAVNWGQKL